MILWYFNHYAVFPEEDNPDRTYYVSREFRARGHRVVVFCASFHHLRRVPVAPSAVGHARVHDGIDYVCLPTRSYRGNTIGRFLNMLDFARAIPPLARDHAQSEFGTPEVIISSSPHPLSFPPAYRVARRFHAATIYEVRDLWPLDLIHVVGMHPWHPLAFWMGAIEKRACRRAGAVVSALPRAIDHLHRQGLDPARFLWIPNGVSAAEWERSPEPLPGEYQRELDGVKERGKLLVVYGGAQGPPNALDQILDLNRITSADRPYHFVLIGDGIHHEELKARVRRERIDFVTFIPRLNKSRLRSALQQADVCFIGWSGRRHYRFGISPKKIGDYFMAGKPIVHAVDAGNDPVAEAKAGISVTPYVPEELDRALRQLAAMSKDERDVIGSKGKAYALANLEWSALGAQYVKLCESLIRR